MKRLLSALAAPLQDVDARALDRQLEALASHISLKLQQQSWGLDSRHISTNKDLLLQVVPMLWGVRQVLLQHVSVQQQQLAVLWPSESAACST